MIKLFHHETFLAEKLVGINEAKLYIDEIKRLSMYQKCDNDLASSKLNYVLPKVEFAISCVSFFYSTFFSFSSNYSCKPPIDGEAETTRKIEHYFFQVPILATSF